MFSYVCLTLVTNTNGLQPAMRTWLPSEKKQCSMVIDRGGGNFYKGFPPKLVLSHNLVADHSITQ